MSPDGETAAEKSAIVLRTVSARVSALHLRDLPGTLFLAAHRGLRRM